MTKYVIIEYPFGCPAGNTLEDAEKEAINMIANKHRHSNSNIAVVKIETVFRQKVTAEKIVDVE